MARLRNRDHEAQRAAWAVGWFLSLLKGRRTGDLREIDRSTNGLSALGIHVEFDEDRDEENADGSEDAQ